MAVYKFSTNSLKTPLKYSSFLAGNAAVIPPSYESIATASGTGSSGTITFSSIPSIYTHLQIRAIGRNSYPSSQTNVRFNSDTGSNYANHMLYTDGSSSTYAAQNTSQTFFRFYGLSYSSITAGVMSGYVIDILDYAALCN